MVKKKWLMYFMWHLSTINNLAVRRKGRIVWWFHKKIGYCGVLSMCDSISTKGAGKVLHKSPNYLNTTMFHMKSDKSGKLQYIWKLLNIFWDNVNIYKITEVTTNWTFTQWV